MKKFLSVLLCVMVSTVALFAAGEKETTASGEKVFEMKLAHIQAPDHPNALGSVEFARLVEERTNGQIKISVFPGSQLGGNEDLYDSCALGTIDFTVLGFGEPAKTYSPFELLDGPYLAKDRDHFVRILNSDVFKEMCDEMEAATNVETLGAFYYGARYVTTNNFPVREPADLKGHTIRVPDHAMYVSTLNAMGAKATPMAFSDLYVSLQQNVIDGQENPVATIASKKFDEVQKYYCQTEHIMGGNCMYVSSKSMEKLTPELREIVRECGVEACDYINQLAFAAEDKYKVELQERGMILIDDVDKAAFEASVQSIYEGDSGKWSKDVYNRIKAVK